MEGNPNGQRVGEAEREHDTLEQDTCRKDIYERLIALPVAFAT